MKLVASLKFAGKLALGVKTRDLKRPSQKFILARRTKKKRS